MSTSNVESLLTAILTGDEEYIVVPQSRVEELLLAIYKNGGGGGGGEGGVDEFARAELLKKVNKRDGYALISTAEIERLAKVDNYDDTAVKALIDKKVTAKSGFSLIDDKDYANFKTLENYDDTAIKTLIDKKVDDTVTVAGLKITTNITASQLATALNLSNYVTKDGSKVLSTNDFTNDYKNQIDTNTTDITKKVNKTSVSSSNETTSVINVTDAKVQMAMVAKISGKTYKRNLFNIKEATTGSPASFTITDTYISNAVIDTRAQLMLFVLAGTAMTRVIQDDTVTVGKHSYSFTATANADRLTIRHNGSSVDFNCQVPVNIVSGKTYTLSMNVTGNNPKVVGGVKISEIQFEEGSVANPYVPFGLISTPVESVVSRGLNMADTIYGKTLNVTYGTEGDGIGVISNFVEVDHSKTYYVTGISTNTSNNCFYAWYDANKNFIARSTSASRTYIGITGLPSNAKYIRVNQYLQSASEYASVKLMMSESASTPYTPYNKTTVLVPSEARNCVGYGLGIDADCCNIYDCENGTHTIMCKEIDLTGRGWARISDGEFYSAFDEVSSTKLYGYKGICSKYNVYIGAHGGIPDKSLSIASGSFSTTKRLFLKDSSCKTVEEVVAAMKGVKLVYELSSAETKSLTDFIRPLPVEAGGTLTLANEHNLDMNSTIKYKKEV